MKKKTAALMLAAAVLCSSVSAFASGAIPDHRGTSMDGFEIGTQQLNSLVKGYTELFKQAGDQYGVDPNLIAAICMQESSGRNLSYRDDGSEYPAWGIMQIEYSLENAFADFGERTTGVRWTLQDRLDEEKSVQFAAYLISQSLVHYDCDYMKMLQAYNFGQTVLDRIIDAKGDGWLYERANAAAYASNWGYSTYGDANYIEHVLRYYHNDIEYVGVKVRLNGSLLTFEDQYPILETVDEKTYTLVPIRAVSEALNAEVTWDGDNKSVHIAKDGNEMMLFLGSQTAWMNGKEIPLDMSARLKNNRTMVPLRFIMEAFNVNVEWNQDTRTVELSI